MFNHVGALFQGAQCLTWVNRHDFLVQNRPGIDAFIRNQVHHHPRVLDAAALECFVRPFNGICACKHTWESGVQVDHLSGKA